MRPVCDKNLFPKTTSEMLCVHINWIADMLCQRLYDISTPLCIHVLEQQRRLWEYKAVQDGTGKSSTVVTCATKSNIARLKWTFVVHIGEQH